MTGPNITYRHSPWDSELLGFDCGFLDIRDDGGAEARARDILAEARKNQSKGLVALKIPAEWKRLCADLKKQGALKLGQETTFRFKGALPSPPPQDRAEVVSEFSGDDFLALADDLAWSRLFMDARIPRHRARALWRESIRNHLRGRARGLGVSLREGRPAGLVVVNQAGPGHADLYLVGVLPEFRGAGAGKDALNAVLARYAAANTVTVQAYSGNKPAQGLYQKAGFAPFRAHEIFHVWLEDRVAGFARPAA